MKKEVNEIFDLIKESSSIPEFRDLIEQIKIMWNENENLKQRIDKAIEYLYNKIPYWREWHYDDIDVDGDILDLLDILKGEDK